MEALSKEKRTMDSLAIEKRTMGKMRLHLLPLCVVLYVINGIDRSNLGFTALDMNSALGISTAAFGTLTAMFFIGYFFFEIPSNMFMHRTGARLWMGRIMFTWGLVTCGMFFAQNFTHVATLRILLGVCEAGFFPGMMYYFTYWFPARHRASVIATFFIAAPIGGLIGAPLATQIMANIHWFGVEGWRWVFMIEGMFALVGAVVTWVYLKNKPQDVSWLNAEEKDWLETELTKEADQKTETAHFTVGKVFSYGKIWRLALIYMFAQITTQTFGFWMPTLVKEFSGAFSNTTVGWLMMLPPICGLVFMLIWGAHSDKTHERVYHTAIPMLVFVIALAMIAFTDNMTIKLIALGLTGIGTYGFYGPYWSVPSLYLSGEALAVGLALINSMSSFGGFSGNMAVGFIKASSLGSTGVFIFQLICIGIAFLMMITLKIDKSKLE